MPTRTREQRVDKLVIERQRGGGFLVTSTGDYSTFDQPAFAAESVQSVLEIVNRELDGAFDLIIE